MNSNELRVGLIRGNPLTLGEARLVARQVKDWDQVAATPRYREYWAWVVEELVKMVEGKRTES